MRNAQSSEVSAIETLRDFLAEMSALRVVDSPPEYELVNALESSLLDCRMMSWHVLNRLSPSVDLRYLRDSQDAMESALRFAFEEDQRSVFHNLGIESRSEIQRLASNYSANSSFGNSRDSYSSHRTRMTIIVHGTWARTETWWRPNSDFWWYLRGRPMQMISGVAEDVYDGSDPFSWSGKNRDSERQLAADELVEWCRRNPTDSLQVIAHSHGGNVAMLAAQQGLRIDRLVLLGTPIRVDYLPPVENPPLVRNVFSTRDFVQTPAGTVPNRRGEGRTVAESTTSANFLARNDGLGGIPGHGDLHNVGCWKASQIASVLR